jgi:hypothetical protein
VLVMLMVPPLAMYWAVPEPGTGGLPSVVYPMEWFVPESESIMESVKVTFPAAGKMDGAVLITGEMAALIVLGL